MSKQDLAKFGFDTGRPYVVMEGRAPLPGQTITRQTFLGAALRKLGVQVLFINLEDAGTFNSMGLVRTYEVYTADGNYNKVLLPEPEGIRAPAWRLRDFTWTGPDMPVFRPGQGYNSTLLRHELSTRSGVAGRLTAGGLGDYIVRNTAINPENPAEWPEGEYLLLKPDVITDVGANEPGRARRARLMRRSDISREVLKAFGPRPIIQQVEPVIQADGLLKLLGKPAGSMPPGALHAIRVYQPLWLPYDSPPVVELRVSVTSSIGRQFPTWLWLLEPRHAFGALPALAWMHQRVHGVLTASYDKLNYPAIDFIVLEDGSVKVLNILVRAMTPGLEGWPAETQHLAEATAEVEVTKLRELAELGHVRR